MNLKQSASARPLAFFLLVWLLSLPIWLLGSAYGQALASRIPINLPLSALMTFCPLAAAALLTAWDAGGAGVRRLLGRIGDYRRIPGPGWYALLLLCLPTLLLLAYALMRWLGRPLPAQPHVPLWMALPFFALFFIGAIGEELGWTGYALDPLQRRWGALPAALLIGFLWGVWHIVPFRQGARPPDWIFWQVLGMLPMRVLIVWLYNHTRGSVFAVLVFHTMVNVSTYLFPNYGSHFDPLVVSLLLCAAAALAVLGWGMGTPPAPPSPVSWRSHGHPTG